MSDIGMEDATALLGPPPEELAGALPAEPAGPLPAGPGPLPAELPGQPMGMPSGLMPAPLPPDPQAIIQAMVASRPAQQPDMVSARDRLLLGPKVRSGDLTPRVAETAPMPDVLAQELTGIKPSSRVNDKLINVGARMEQVRAAAADPDKAAANWKRVAAAKSLLPAGFQSKMTRLLDGDALPEDEWAELSIAVDRTADAIDKVGDDWTVGSGRVTAIDPRPDGVFLQVSFQDSEDVDQLPDSLTGDAGLTLPSHTLAKAASGFDVFVGPSDVTYAAKVTVENDFAIRSQFPGPIGKDGIPRWSKVTALPLTDHAAITSGLAHEPLAVVESYADPEAYSGLHPGEYIVFDVPEKEGRPWVAPAWTGTGVTPVRAGVARSGPATNYHPLGKDDIPDVSTAYDRLDDTSWAVVDVEPGALEALGFKPIPVQTSGGATSQLVFGAIPADLEEVSPSKPIYTTDGIVYPFGVEEDSDAPLPSWHFKAANGTVAWAAEDGETSGAVSRVDRRARRMAYRVDPVHTKRIAQLASDLEVSGAGNVSIYSRQAKLDGFEAARERVFSDGVSVKVVRTSDHMIGEPNSIPVHVRSTVGLPKNRVPIDPEKISTVSVEPIQGKFRVSATEDLAEATTTAAVLAQRYGYQNVVIDGPDGEIKLYEPA